MNRGSNETKKSSLSLKKQMEGTNGETVGFFHQNVKRLASKLVLSLYHQSNCHENENGRETPLIVT